MHITWEAKVCKPIKAHFSQSPKWCGMILTRSKYNLIIKNCVSWLKKTDSRMSWEKYIDATVSDLQERHVKRELHVFEPMPATFSGFNKHNFMNNDYLGLSGHQRVRKASASLAMQEGNGPRSSPLVSGYTSYHRSLEARIAQLKKTDDALLFSSGFAANIAVLSSLLKDGNVDVFSDQLNHASIIDGIRLGNSYGKNNRILIYRHSDIDHLELLLKSMNQETEQRKKLVVTDSLFSMDGDFANLPELVRLKKKYGFLLIIDEAHATLVCGENGGGAAEMFGVQDSVDVHVGTLSKAIGSQGGFVACGTPMKQFFLNKGRTYVFSTALPIPTVATALEAINIGQSPEGNSRRKHLYALIDIVARSKILATIIPYRIHPNSPIIIIPIGCEEKTLAMADMLMKQDTFRVAAIRPPTVPTARLRISLSSDHTLKEVGRLVSCLEKRLTSDQTRMWVNSRL